MPRVTTAAWLVDTALRSQNANCNFHPVNIFRSGFGANQNHRILFRAVPGLFDRIVGGENDLPDRQRPAKLAMPVAVSMSSGLTSLLIQPRHKEIVRPGWDRDGRSLLPC